MEILLCVFQDDEYAVYNVNLQCIRYLVEFTVRGDLPLIERVIFDQTTIEPECSSSESQQKGVLFYTYMCTLHSVFNANLQYNTFIVFNRMKCRIYKYQKIKMIKHNKS